MVQQSPSPPPCAHQMISALYVNYFEVGHNPFEFLIDLGQYRSDGDDVGAVAIHTRIATSPTHAKLLARLLGDAVAAHEEANGPIATVRDGLSALEVVRRSLPEFDARAESIRAARADLAASSASRRVQTER